MRFFLRADNAALVLEVVSWLLVCGLLAYAFVAHREIARRPWARTLVLTGLLMCSLLAAWSNFFQSRNNGRWIHRWDLFHTAIGAKYFPELGYDHLYDCAYVLGAERLGRHFRRVKKIRNLKTLKYDRPHHVLANNDCAQRFSPQRRAAFVDDLEAFSELGMRNRWHRAFKDKGFNGTPVYRLIAHIVFERVPLTYGALLRLALIDIALLLAALAVVWRTRGLAVACLALGVLAVCFPGRFIHMGGSFLRFDYLAALMMGACALSTARPALGGGLFAYATLMRAFPALYALGAGLVLALPLLQVRRLPREALRFCLGFAAVSAVLVGATFLSGDGLTDWLAWWEEIRVHTRNSAGFRVGFKHMFMLDGNLLGDRGFVSFADKTAHYESRRAWYLLAAAALIGPVVLRARALDAASFSVLFGTLLFFVLMIATRYYYVLLALPVLADPERLGRRSYALMVGSILLASAITYRIADAWTQYAPFLYNTVTTVTLTLLAAGLSVWSVLALLNERRTRTLLSRH